MRINQGRHERETPINWEFDLEKKSKEIQKIMAVQRLRTVNLAKRRREVSRMHSPREVTTELISYLMKSIL